MATALSAIVDAIDLNSDYDVTQDVEKARLFVAAARKYIMRAPKRTGNNASYTELDLEVVAKQLEDATSWLAANDTTEPLNPDGGVKTFSFEDFR